MKLTCEWKTCLDDTSARAYVEALSTLIGEEAAGRLVEIARIYEQYDWFRVLIAKAGNDIAGMIGFYYEPLHGSHEAWICVNPQFRRKGVGDRLQAECDKGARDNGIRILRADATLQYTHSQKYLFRRGYKAVGYTPMSFSFLRGKESLGSAVTVWKIFDEELLRQWHAEKRESLDWDSRRWSVQE